MPGLFIGKAVERPVVLGSNQSRPMPRSKHWFDGIESAHFCAAAYLQRFRLKLSPLSGEKKVSVVLVTLRSWKA